MKTSETMKMKPVERLMYWITEREAIWANKITNQPKPWTDDEILQNYRFCNVYREKDTVTQWIASNWRDPNSGHADNWFAMAVARWINWPESLEEIGYPVPWKPDRVIEVLKSRRNRGDKVWTGAYMIGTQGNAKDKPLFIVQDVLDPLWKRREELRPKQNTTLAEFAQKIIDVKNQGRFMVGQIVADMKYDALSPLHIAKDWETFAVSGPGSRRGMNLIVGRHKDHAWNEREWHRELIRLRIHVNAKLPEGMEPLHAQDLQNCLCEYDKYCRVLFGEGKPRARYNGRS